MQNNHRYDGVSDVMSGARYYPIIIIVGFNVLTLLAYLISPYIFLGGAFEKSVVFILINICMLGLGYLFGIKLGLLRFSGQTGGRIDYNLRIFNFFLVFYALTFLVKYAYLLKFPVTDVAGMVRFLLVGWSDPKLGYALSFEGTRVATIPWSFMFLISIFNGVFFIVGFIFWGQISLLKKAAFVFFVSIEVFYWVGRGTNFGLIMLLLVFLLSRAASGATLERHVIKSSFIFFFAALLIFTTIMSFRAEGSSEDLRYYALSMSVVDEESLLFDIVPDVWHVLMMLVFSYLVQGYFYMSVAFDMDFSPTWFGGWNSAVMSLYEFMGIDIKAESYVYRLDGEGIDPLVNWHSAYTWFANDVSFFGVPFVVLMIGLFIGASWVGVKVANDFLSKIIFVLLSGGAIFFFANTNFFAYHFYSLIVIFPLWLFWFGLGRSAKKIVIRRF